jgi:predicted P-loop ATPase
MTPELKQILDTLQQFADKFEAKAWYDKHRDEIIPLLTDLYDTDENQYTIILQEIIAFMPFGLKGLKDEIKARVKREFNKRIEARLKEHWRDGEEVILQRDKDGAVTKDMLNVVEIMLKSKHLNIVYDRFRNMISFEVYGEHKLPWLISDENMMEIKYPILHTLKEVDKVRYYPATSSYSKAALKYYLSQFFPGELSWRVFEESLVFASRQNAINIQKDYFNNGIPEWDMKDRMDVLHRYAGIKDKEWAVVIAHFIFLSMMARCFEPGYDARGTVILEGPQESGKSWLCRILGFHQDFYTQFTFDKNNHGYEVSRQIAGMAIVEFPDMGGISSRDVNYIKAFMTATHDRNRRMQQDLVEHMDRVGVFIITLNPNESDPYLSDQTGNTRYLIAKCETAKIDVEAIQAELPQLYAQAKYLWEQNVSPRLTEVERIMRDERVKSREVKSDYYHYMLDYLKINRNSFKYDEHENWDDGATEKEIMGWASTETEWYSTKPKHKHWAEIRKVLTKHFHFAHTQKRIPAIRRRIDGPQLTGIKWRYTGNVPWDEFIDSLE